MKKIKAHLVESRNQLDEAYARRVEGKDRLLYVLSKVGRPLTRRLRALVASQSMLRAYGRIVRDKTGVSLWQQARQQYHAAVQHRLPPRQYYLYAIYNDAGRMSQYVSKEEWGILVETLLAKQGTAERIILDDKRATEKHLRQHGLPTIPVLAEFEDGKMIPREWNGESPFPAHDLFSKPVTAKGGEGARRWFGQPDGRYQTEEGDYVTYDELLKRLGKQSKRRPLLLQQRIANHEDLRTLTGPTLASVRLITVRKPEQAAEYLTGFVSLPLGDVIGSNAGFDVARAPIERTTGSLGAAFNRNDIARIMEPLRKHPVTRKRIAGFQLPDWSDAVELATSAHNTLRNIAFIGWDIGLTEHGPIIIEGNSAPGANSIQITHKTPIGATRFPEFYVANLEYLAEANQETVHS
jgi:hypothetical protein